MTHRRGEMNDVAGVIMSVPTEAEGRSWPGSGPKQDRLPISTHDIGAHQPAASAAGRPNRRIFTFATVLLLLFSSFAGMLPTPAPSAVHKAAALSNPLAWPVTAGASWTIGQGYNTKTTEGGSHWACNPKTLKDAPTGSLACRAHYQYQFALDLARSDGNTAFQVALAPAAGTITWTEIATGGGVINLGDGYAFGFFHLRLDPSIVAGARVVRGQRLGVVAPPNEANNGGWPHIHVNLWRSSDGGNWDRNSVPFTGAYTLGGMSLPDLGSSSTNQHRGVGFVSTNTQVGAAGPTPTPTPSLSPTPPPVRPGTPVQVNPANGVAITRQNPTATMVWRTVSGANEYQVVVDDGKYTSPWVTGTTWTTPVLPAGQHAWQVRSRNWGGQSALSVKWLLFVNTSGVPSSQPSASPSATQNPGMPTAGLTASPTGGTATAIITIRGGGFSASEPVRITLDSTSGPLLSTTTAGSDGSISAGITVGNATGGAHTLIARGQTSGRQRTTTYTVAPSLTRTPINGPPGTVVTVTARGFAASERVRLTWLSATGPVLAELTTGSNGTGTATFPLPDAARGWHDYSGVGLTSGARAWGNFGIDPALSLSATSASPGQSLTATARGFGSGQPVTFTWNKSPASAGTTLCTITTNSTGQATCPITVPVGAGIFPVTAATQDGTSQSVSVQVGGSLSVSVSPIGGVVGSSVQVSAGGFSANEAVDARWDNSTTVIPITANGSGTVSQLITVPFLSYGSHTLTLRGQVSDRQASTTFTVRQSISIDPTGGATGTRVTLSAQGMPASQSATAYWNRVSGSAGTPLCSGTVTATGTFSCSLTVPAATANTTYPVTLVAGGTSAQASFQVSGTGSGGPVGPPSSGNGTFVVNATREGLVGGTTSSGHVIRQLDRFVSLPACTASSCPWLTPGVAHAMWGVRTECGSACYVRIVNPANNRCVVAPIEDTGPWFTQDDWWNPTSSRFLNTLPTNPNVLRQGYPGAQAARDGLDVGYGIAPSGIGISNKRYEVGNSAAIDIGDGSWVDLGFNIAGASAGGVTVTMLWQSGENPNAAAQACGQSSANPPAGAGNGTETPRPSVTPRPSTTSTATARPRTPTVAPRTPTATPRVATARPATSTPRATATATPRGTATPRPPRVASLAIPTGTPDQTSVGIASTDTGDHPAPAGTPVTVDLPTGDDAPQRSATPTLDAGTPAVAGTPRPRARSVVIVTATMTATAAPASATATPKVSAPNATPEPGEVIVMIPTLPALATLPALPTIPALPTLPAFPTFPAFPTLPPLPTFPAFPTTASTATPTAMSEPATPAATDAVGEELTATPEPTSEPTMESTAGPTSSSASASTATSEPTASKAPSPTVTIEPTVPATETMEPTATDEPTQTPTPTPTEEPTQTPTAEPTATPTEAPTSTPTEEPTATPTEESTATPTEEPTATPTEEPTPAITPEPVIQLQTLYPIADTSVTATEPDSTQSPDLIGGLAFGGPDGAVSYLTFDVSSVAAPGSVVFATLTLTGTGAGGATGGELLAIPGVIIDEYGVTWNTRPGQAGSAIDSYGGPVWIEWIAPGGAVTADVTGTVSSSGLVTFVLIGLPDLATTIGSRESGFPPYLTVETLVDPGD